MFLIVPMYLTYNGIRQGTIVSRLKLSILHFFIRHDQIVALREIK